MSQVVLPILRCKPFADLSGWNVPINPDILMPKIHGAILRSNVGTIPDKHFAPTRAIFEQRGVPWAGYMFFYADVNRKEQALCTAEQHGKFTGNGYVLESQFGSYDDLEPPSRPVTMSASTFTTRYIEYYNHWVQATNERVRWMYSAKWFVEKYLDSRIKSYADKGFMRYWAAHWNVDNPGIPYQFADQDPQFWLHQYEGTGNRKGKEYGVGSADIDLNEYYATCETFNDDWDIGAVPPPIEPPVEPPTEIELKVKTNVYGLRQRLSPDTSNDLNVVGFFTRPWYHIDETIFFAAWLCSPVSTIETYRAYGLNV